MELNSSYLDGSFYNTSQLVKKNQQNAFTKK